MHKPRKTHMTKPPVQKYICWDLDENLGSFRPGERNGLIKGLLPMLDRLREKGCRHVITTAAMPHYAEIVVSSTGIKDRFEAVFANGIVHPKEGNKRYSRVAERLGINKEEAPERMLVVGNHQHDIPADLDLVTLHHPQAVHFEARVFDIILSELLSSQTWIQGYDILLSRSKKLKNTHFDGGNISINNIELYLGTITKNALTPHVERIVMVASAGSEYRAKVESADCQLNEFWANYSFL